VWAAEAAESQTRGQSSVYVVMFLDGKLDTLEQHDKAGLGGPGRSTSYDADWSFSLIKKVAFLLRTFRKLANIVPLCIEKMTNRSWHQAVHYSYEPRPKMGHRPRRVSFIHCRRCL